MKVIVIGGGPAGMIAAGRAAELGDQVILLEKNSHLGKKLLLTGGGRCNFTQAQSDVRFFSESFGSKGKFLISAFSRFSPTDTLSFFQNGGMDYKVEENLRAFPRDNSAHTVLQTLVNYMKQHHVQIKTETAVEGWHTEQGQIHGVRTKKGFYLADKIILATGGTARPDTGSTGEGFAWLKEIGHQIQPPRPALSSIITRDSWKAEVQGLSLDDVILFTKEPGKKNLRRQGEILFTHFGISGPVVLNASASIQDIFPTPSVKSIIFLDLVPQLSLEHLEKEILEAAQINPGKTVKSTLSFNLPHRLSQQIFLQLAINPDKPLNQVTKLERTALIHRIKAFPVLFDRLRDENYAINSTGGVPPQEVDFKTMQSKKEPKICITGDLLDFDRPTGGFSLQLCWTSGWIAGGHP